MKYLDRLFVALADTFHPLPASTAKVEPVGAGYWAMKLKNKYSKLVVRDTSKELSVLQIKGSKHQRNLGLVERIQPSVGKRVKNDSSYFS